MFTNLSAVQINLLAQRLSEAPLGRSASVAAAAERFERLLAVRIGGDRATKAVKAILTAPGMEAAEGRLVAEIETCREATAPPATPEQALEPAPIAEAQPAVAAEPTIQAMRATPSAPHRRRDADIEAKARQGELPPPPDFSAPTHARFRAKLAKLLEMAGKADATGLRAFQINPVSSSPKALARYRNLAVMAIEARLSRA